MSLSVSKSPPVMVRPSTLTEPAKKATTQVQLSSWDRSYVGFQVTAVLIFDGPAQQRPIEAIKKGLSKALVPYSPIAGRLAPAAGAGDEDDLPLQIECTGEGVPFVAASAECALADQEWLHGGVPVPGSALYDLASYYPAPEPARTEPLLVMQVTEFSCGGFSVGVTWNHALADGDGMAQFLQAVGELTRGAIQTPSVAPVRDGGEVPLPALSPAVVAGKQWLMLDRGGGAMDDDDMVYLDVTIPNRLIDRIKSDYKNHDPSSYCTTFEAAIAVLWQCRTRAIGTGSMAMAPLAFFVNVRKGVGAAAGYYGNCAVAQVAMATGAEVAGGDICDVVRLIKRAKESVPELLRREGGGAVEGMAEMGEEETAALFGYNAFMVTSWRNIGFDRADFGAGAPARVVGRWQQSTVPGCMAFLACRAAGAGEDGGEKMLTQCVRAEHAAAFLAEIDKLASYAASAPVAVATASA
ncbi:acyl transferase 15 [Brachypodium distachyon]|uniref:Uncharacterized protein n=1 Tax=Brachypodium distachyon TaxID=15368 RepID=I1IVH8_BRADI|nr:acyl transferase 15 [Brachypodium distachyon]KQJ81444.1 hypothetical protein BRADI_5g00750v3 [Brachypodium distachyon]|eukprot:XP_003580934.1 acyl transferase 15 [Brachypodium distachyon]